MTGKYHTSIPWSLNIKKRGIKKGHYATMDLALFPIFTFHFGPRGRCVVRGVRANQPRPWDAETPRRYAVDANASSPSETPKNLCVTMWRLTLALQGTCFFFKSSCSKGDGSDCKVFFLASVGLRWEKMEPRHQRPVRTTLSWIPFFIVRRKSQSQSVHIPNHTESNWCSKNCRIVNMSYSDQIKPPFSQLVSWSTKNSPVLWGQFDLSRTLCSVPGVLIFIFALSSVDADNSGPLT